MSVLQAEPVPATHTAEVTHLLKPINGFHVEPRCRVCRNPAVCRKVNDLLVAGTSYRMVLRALDGENDKLDKRDRITIDSIRNHTNRHFPVQNAAKATYRAILEQRAKENGTDFVNGVATAITPMAFLETVMIKSYENLVDSDTTVDVNTGMIAAGRLQAMLETRAMGTSVVDMMVQLHQIINAVKTTVPEALWPEIQRKLQGDGEDASELLEDEDEVFYPEDDSSEDDELGG